jgi:hypothetical protein
MSNVWLFQEGFFEKCAEAGLTNQQADFLYKEAVSPAIAKLLRSLALGTGGTLGGLGLSGLVHKLRHGSVESPGPATTGIRASTIAPFLQSPVSGSPIQGLMRDHVPAGVTPTAEEAKQTAQVAALLRSVMSSLRRSGDPIRNLKEYRRDAAAFHPPEIQA